MNIFKKVLLIALSAGLLSVPSTLDTVEAASRTIYLKAGCWDTGGAVFYGHFWGDGDEDVKFQDSDNDGIYEATITSNATNVIFTRCQPTSTGVWDKVWDRVETTVSSNKNLFTITGWAAGEWGTYTYVEPKWSVVGSNIVGVGNWDIAETSTEMTKQEDGSYQIVLEFSEASEFKVALNHAWDTAYPSSNYKISQAGYYTITFTSTKEVTATPYHHHLETYVQKGTEAGTVRFIGTFGDKYFTYDISKYDEVGFTFTSNGKEVNLDAGYIYTSVTADNQTISASEYNAQYFFCITFTGVAEGTEFTATPFARLLAGGTETGATIAYTF